MYSGRVPTKKSTTVESTPDEKAIRRAHQEIKAMKTEKTEGIIVHPDETNIMVFHAIIEGPADTPYSGGFFYFYIQLPNNYPWSPPTIKLMTTGGRSVRFNPNLYECGKVCLSILGTWEGPPWRPVLTIMKVLLSIQSLLNEEPYYNEPGYTKGKGGKTVEMLSKKYSENIRYQTLRVAIIGMIKNTYGDSSALPTDLKNKIKSRFVQQYDANLAIIQKTDSQRQLMKEFAHLKMNINNGNI